jgi:DNA-binding MarR family transcriptional regulator
MTPTPDPGAVLGAELVVPPTAPATDGVTRLLSALRQVKLLWAEVTRTAFPGGASGLGVLHLLDQDGPQRVSDLAVRAHVGVSTMSRHVADLTAAGLLDRDLDPADGRTHLLRLTPAGAAELARARLSVLDRLRPALDGWADDELAALTGQLTRLATDLATCGRDGRSLERNP